MVRPSTKARGYGQRHRAERERWRPIVDAGRAVCARCKQPIEPGRPWDMGHTDDRTAWTGPEHRACNRKAGGVNGATVSNALRRSTVRQSRPW